MYYGKTLGNFKSFEVQLDKANWNYFNFQLQWSKKCDHAGITLMIECFGYFLNVSFVDTRHWDYEANSWKVYEEETCR